MNTPGAFPVRAGAFPVGRDDWGNLRRRVALRHDPLITGLVISDMGEVQLVALGETGTELIGPAANWVGVGSPMHRAALAALP